MNSFTIRRATQLDLPTLQTLTYRLHDEHYQAEPEHFKTADEVLKEKQISDYLDDPECFLFVAVKQQQIIGFVTGHFCELISTISPMILMGSVDELYVEPQFRCQGMGKGLLERCFHEFKDYGVKQIFVEVWDFNQSAIKLYQELGFKHHIHYLRKAVE